MVITFNFKDGTETITFADLEKSALGSDFKVSGAPKVLCSCEQRIFYPSRQAWYIITYQRVYHCRAKFGVYHHTRMVCKKCQFDVL